MNRIDGCLYHTMKEHQKSYKEKTHFQWGDDYIDFFSNRSWRDSTYDSKELTIGFGPISVYTPFGDSNTSFRSRSDALKSLVITHLRTILDDKYIKIILHEQLYMPTEIVSCDRVQELLNNAYKTILKEYVQRSRLAAPVAEEIESEFELFRGRRFERSYDVDYNHDRGLFEIELNYIFLDDDESNGSEI